LSRIFFDTNLFIYLLEDTQGTGAEVALLIQRMEERGDHLITSTLTVGEVLVKPIEENDAQLIEQYTSLLLHSSIVTIPFDSAAAFHYAAIRRDRSIKAPDALQLACAASSRCDLFITNDESLGKKTVPGIQFIVTLSRVPI
jgi:predicted nucleic acid-binding protein